MKPTKHGMCKTKFYDTWRLMKARCLNPNNPSYYNYGGRGITVCDRWIKFEGFYEDMIDSFQKHININDSKNTSIDRINNNGNYELSNCRWATMKEQSRNRKTNRLINYNNKKLILKEWSELLSINYITLQKRFKLNWSIEKAFNAPIGKQGNTQT